jgi:hypothetical protein
MDGELLLARWESTASVDGARCSNALITLPSFLATDNAERMSAFHVRKTATGREPSRTI